MRTSGSLAAAATVVSAAVTQPSKARAVSANGNGLGLSDPVVEAFAGVKDAFEAYQRRSTD